MEDDDDQRLFALLMAGSLMVPLITPAREAKALSALVAPGRRHPRAHPGTQSRSRRYSISTRCRG